MKNFLSFTALLATAVAFASCDKGTENKLDSPPFTNDPFKFSTTQVAFTRSAGSQTVTSQGDAWGISGLEIDGNPYLKDSLAKMEAIWGVPQRWDGGMTWTEIPDSLSNKVEIKQVAADWVTFSRNQRKELTIEVTANETGKARQAILEVQSGNNFSSVTVTQQAAE